MKAPIPHDEMERLDALRSYRVLDTLAEPSFDDIALLASEICGTPIAAISLIDTDRQWFKSIVGLDVQETPRDVAFCAHAILNPDEPMIVEDATSDERFADNPLVTNEPRIRFYAGTPLVTPGGHALGTLCVIDLVARELQPGQRRALEVLGREVVAHLELRTAVRDLEQKIVELKKADTVLEMTRREQLELKDRFISHVSHELRSPLTAIYQFVTLLRDEVVGEVSEEQAECLDVALRNADALKRMIGDLLEVTRAQTNALSVERRRIQIGAIVTDVVETLNVKAAEKGLSLFAVGTNVTPDAVGDPGRVRQVLVNLIENAIKFTPEGGSVAVRVGGHTDATRTLQVSIEDSGCGLGAADCERVFEYMYQTETRSEQARKGLGLGLYICRELITRQGGRIWVESEEGEGSRFIFTLPVFALDGLIAPLLSPANLLQGSVALLAVDVFRRGRPVATTATRQPFDAAWDVVKSCINPSMDCVLPRFGDDSRGDTLVVVAIADEAGANLLARRIDEQLRAHPQTRDAGIEWSIDTTLLAMPSVGKDGERNELAEKIAQLVSARLADDPALRRAA